MNLLTARPATAIATPAFVTPTDALHRTDTHDPGTARTGSTAVDSTSRSHIMYSLHEALAREHQREYEQRARQARLVKQVTSERRYHRAVLRKQRSPRR